MAEYIEREALMRNLKKFAPEQLTPLIKSLIQKQPAEDVVEVVRKPVVGYEGCYDVDQLGRVYSVDRVISVEDNGRVYYKPLKGKQMKQSIHTTVCINRQRYYVHILIGEFIYGKIRKGYVIHHKDKNKLNAMPDNLELMTNLRHSKIHGKERKGIDLRSEEGKQKGINAAAKARRRSDVTLEMLKL